MKMPKHIKMNMDIDTYEIDLNSEKPKLNQYETNKLEGNQKRVKVYLLQNLMNEGSQRMIALYKQKYQKLSLRAKVILLQNGIKR